MILSATLGILVGGAGYHIGKTVERAQSEALNSSDTARLQLAHALLQKDLQLAAGRLEELPRLPLLEGFFHASTMTPDSGNTAELKAYLNDVFAASATDPSIDALVAYSARNNVLLKSNTTTSPPQNSAKGGSAVIIDETSNPQTLRLRAVVPADASPEDAAGFLLAPDQSSSL
ncbi:MAG: hypothetical protein QNJ43_01910 [Breoghania sp.]|nr:hypothetical protein [Breoghania sp.]